MLVKFWANLKNAVKNQEINFQQGEGWHRKTLYPN
jgi:hypothetical protein